MKNVSAILLLMGWAFRAFAQTSPSVSSPTVANILKGLYTPADYAAANAITDPSVISGGLVTGISPDSLKATLFKMKGFQNRNMFSDTMSNTRGIGAARRWVYDKFKQYSNAGGNRLQVAYLQFNYNPTNSS